MIGTFSLRAHIGQISEATDPALGPATYTESLDRLLEYYERLNDEERAGFVAVLITDLLALKAHLRMLERQRVVEGAVE